MRRPRPSSSDASSSPMIVVEATAVRASERDDERVVDDDARADGGVVAKPVVVSADPTSSTSSVPSETATAMPSFPSNGDATPSDSSSAAPRRAVRRRSSDGNRAPFPERRYTAVRMMGLWRLGFFVVLLREWNDGGGGGGRGGRSHVLDFVSWFGDDVRSLPKLDLERDDEGGKFGVDRWFRYNHLSWVQDYDAHLQRNADKENSGDPSSLGYFDLTHEATSKLGSACCLLAAAGGEGRGTALVPWIVPAGTFVVLYAFRLFSTTTSYSDRKYLHLLLLVLTVYSGGGSIANNPTGESRRRRCRRRRACETAAVAIRIQFAIVHFYSALWKLHVNWLNGSVARGMLLLDPEREEGGYRSASPLLGAYSRVPWSKIDHIFPAAFAIVAICDLATDVLTFACLTFRKPNRSDAGAMLAITVAYQAVVRGFWFGGRIGCEQMAVGILGSLLCHFPFGVIETTAAAGATPVVATATNGSATPAADGVSDGRKKRRSKRGASREDPRRSPSLPPAATSPSHPSRDAILEADASLLAWMKIYYAIPWSDSVTRILDGKPEVVVCIPTVKRRLLVFSWLAFQALLPMRIFFLGGWQSGAGQQSAYTGRATRLGWFDAAHSRKTRIVVRGPHRRIVATMPLSYLVPSCPASDDDPSPGGNRVHVPRSSYLPKTSRSFEDDRTLPLSVVLGPRHFAAMDDRPGSLLAPVAAGMAQIVDDRISMAHDGGSTCRGVEVRATHFVRLDGRGPYVRVVDPTADLVSVVPSDDDDAPESSSRRRFLEWLDALLDRPSRNGGYLLAGRIGSRFRAESESLERDLRRRFPGRTVNLVADRSPCLAASPLWLRPNGRPTRVIALRAPVGRSLTVRSKSAAPTEEDDGVATKTGETKTTALHPGSSSSSFGGGTVKAEVSTESFELEIGIGGGGGERPDDDAACRDMAEEDVLFALVL